MLELLAASEAQVHSTGVHPYVVGVVALVIMHVLLLALLAFGKGREHT